METRKYKPCVFWTILLICVTLGCSITVDDCPEGAKKDMYYLQVMDNYCFRFELSSDRDFDDAEDECERDGGYLAMPKTSKISNFLYDKLARVYRYEEKVWIGLNDQDDEGDYEYVDGTKLDDFPFTNWADDKGPDRYWANRKIRDCVTLDMDEHGQWVDEFCEDGYFAGKSRYYVCQYQVGKTPSLVDSVSSVNNLVQNSKDGLSNQNRPEGRDVDSGQNRLQGTDDAGQNRPSGGDDYSGLNRPSGRDDYVDQNRPSGKDDYSGQTRPQGRDEYSGQTRPQGRDDYSGQNEPSGRDGYTGQNRRGGRDNYNDRNSPNDYDI